MAEQSLQLTFRQATSADENFVLRGVLGCAFDSEGLKLDPDTARSGVRNFVKNDRNGFYVIAFSSDETPVGLAAVSMEYSDWNDGWYWNLGSVYVVPEARRKKVFTRLYDYIAHQAKANSQRVISIRLYVEEHNQGAKETYRRLGMADAGYQMMEQRIS